MSLHLLDLPAEVLLACLGHLPLGDILSLLALHNRSLSTLIYEAPAIQFRMEQAAHAAVETPYGRGAAAPLFARRQALRDREDRWRAFSPVDRWEVAVRDMGLYDVGEDCYALAYNDDPQRETGLFDRMEYMFLDDRGRWRAPEDITLPVVDLCVVSERDLMVVVTFAASADMCALAVHLRQLSTGAVQDGLPRKIDVTTVPERYGVPDIRVEAAGATLALACCFMNSDELDGEHDKLHVVHWPSGHAIAAVPCEVPSFVFLQDTLILAPNPLAHTLDVLAVGAETASWVLAFRLPWLRVGQRIFWETFACRGAPNPHSSPSLADDPRFSAVKTRTAFRPDPEQSLLVLMFATGPTDQPTPEPARTVVVVDRAGLAQCFQRAYERADLSEGAPLEEVPFEVWAPQAAVWLDASGMGLSGYAATGVGTRFAALSGISEADPESKHVRVLDFSAASVEHVRAQLGERGANADTCIVSEHATVRLVKPDFDLPMHDAFADVLVSALPYVDIVSREAVDWESVHLSNACIIGEKGSVDGGRVLDILHFG
ncbi:hypothetical protein MIND_00645000 [Mycena indigotica]|uniref:F-box domain-containing protein n=1 Tax=Mycena indigotica TaxID=2126181 RepID=A0A8H6W9H5_9AGAR|nr:uncharacterized protein MIND_00645000 [Mycena indigotica]KAF7304134.1 hypothetical protein MIND_00645000 [Mycena indigotica]